eukprot:SAG31_NODE_30507_length_380_cov_0.736655_1_plen_97_part_01
MLPMFRAAISRASCPRVCGQGSRMLPLSQSPRPIHTTAVMYAGVSNKHIDTEYNNAETPFEFNEKSMVEIKELLSKYPANYKQSAVIPMLWIAQKQN